MVDKQLANEPYYHGLLPREDMKSMLVAHGEFLIRTTEPTAGQPRAFVLSVMVKPDQGENGIKHFVIKNAGGKWFIDSYSFSSIPELIQHHFQKNESVSKKEEVLLKRPVVRQIWELHHEDIECTKKLGEGAFGEVQKGVLTTKANKKYDVAVKLAKLEVLTKEQIKAIMKEARLMRGFEHPNVVKFYGVAAGQEPLMLVMELVNCGALDSYLQKSEQTMEKKTEMNLQAAWGIEYLHLKQVLHRDIASRNCLYGNGQVKISDFGLTREGLTYQMDPKRKVPIKWLAPETMKTSAYSQKTDVYSYGIMCWEIYNNGLEPFGEMKNIEVVINVRKGYRMPLPDNLNPEIAELINKKVWPDNPDDRLSMADIAKELERITKIPRPDFVAIAAEQREKDKTEFGTQSAMTVRRKRLASNNHNRSKWAAPR